MIASTIIITENLCYTVQHIAILLVSDVCELSNEF